MAQNFEFSTSLGHQLFNKKIMKNSTNSNSWSFEAAYFPRFNLPVGIVFSYGLDVPDNFSSFYPSDKQPSNPTLFDNEYENKIEIKSRTSKYLVGLKLSNQENRSLINPYFLVSIGLGVSKSVFKEFEFVYWQQETLDDQGNIRYDENGDPMLYDVDYKFIEFGPEKDWGVVTNSKFGMSLVSPYLFLKNNVKPQ